MSTRELYFKMKFLCSQEGLNEHKFSYTKLDLTNQINVQNETHINFEHPDNINIIKLEFVETNEPKFWFWNDTPEGNHFFNDFIAPIMNTIGFNLNNDEEDI